MQGNRERGTEGTVSDEAQGMRTGSHGSRNAEQDLRAFMRILICFVSFPITCQMKLTLIHHKATWEAPMKARQAKNLLQRWQI